MVFEIITVKGVTYAVTKVVQSHLISCVVAALVLGTSFSFHCYDLSPAIHEINFVVIIV